MNLLEDTWFNNPAIQKAMWPALLETLQITPFESAQQTITMLRDAVEKHRDGAEPNDDLTMLCLKVMKSESNNILGL